MTDRELLELIATQVSTLTNQVGTLNNRVGILTTQGDTITNQVGTLTSQVGMLTTQGDTITNQVGTLTKQAGAITGEVALIKETVVGIENDHGLKLNALLDGYKLHSEKLEMIAAEVSKHEEIILRRIG